MGKLESLRIMRAEDLSDDVKISKDIFEGFVEVRVERENPARSIVVPMSESPAKKFSRLLKESSISIYNWNFKIAKMRIRKLLKDNWNLVASSIFLGGTFLTMFLASICTAGWGCIGFIFPLLFTIPSVLILIYNYCN